MELLDAHLGFLTRHLYLVVFGAFVMEGFGLPLPSRLILIVAGTLTDTPRALLLLVVTCTAGAIVGDHIPFLGGRLAGARLLTFYCRLTLGSSACVEQTVAYFQRFGAAAITLCRFSTGIRIFAAALSGCGHIGYARFLLYDVAGTIVYALLWVLLRHFVGSAVADLLARYRALGLLVLVVPAAFIALIGYRVWRRVRYGAADTPTLKLEGPN